MTVMNNDKKNNSIKKWKTLTLKLKMSRACFELIERDNKFFLFGGYEGMNKKSTTIEIVNFDFKKTEILKINNIELPLHPTLFDCNEKLIVFGGYNH